MRLFGSLLGVVTAGVLAGNSYRAPAADALTFPLGPGSDISFFTVGGGHGWSFVPTTNMVMTSVGYFNLKALGGDPNIVVTLWAGTNTVIASYTGITNPAADVGTIISTAISPVSLTHGQTYSITVHTTPIATAATDFSLLDSSGAVTMYTWILAPQLSQYQSLALSPGGTLSYSFADPTQNQQLLLLGPTFSYDFSLPRPLLNMTAGPSQTVQLTWPTNASGYSLQRSLVVTGTYANITNVPTIIGTNYSTTLPSTNASGFFRLAKPN